MAWTVPVVAVGVHAPAFAASPCDTSYPWRLDWGQPSTAYTRGNVVSGIQTGTATITGEVGTSPVVVTFRSQMTGSMQRDGDNLNLSSTLSPSITNVGGLGQGPGLNISHDAAIPSGRSNSQELSISFDREVTGLAFVITDVDAQQGGWIDMVELSGNRTGSGPNIQGSGTSDSPWLPTSYGNADNSSAARNISVSYTSPIAANTPLLLKFWNYSGNGNQRIFLSDLTFNARGC